MRSALGAVYTLPKKLGTCVADAKSLSVKTRKVLSQMSRPVPLRTVVFVQ